jgi:hypothetical protein
MVGQISIAVFSGTHDILNTSQGKRLILCDFWKMLFKIDSLYIGIWKIYIKKQFPRNNLDEISRKQVQRNFAECREIKISFVVISYFAK